MYSSRPLRRVLLHSLGKCGSFPTLNLHRARVRRNHGRPRPNSFSKRARRSIRHFGSFVKQQCAVWRPLSWNAASRVTMLQKLQCVARSQQQKFNIKGLATNSWVRQQPFHGGLQINPRGDWKCATCTHEVVKTVLAKMLLQCAFHELRTDPFSCFS